MLLGSLNILNMIIHGEQGYFELNLITVRVFDIAIPGGVGTKCPTPISLKLITQLT